MTTLTVSDHIPGDEIIGFWDASTMVVISQAFDSGGLLNDLSLQAISADKFGSRLDLVSLDFARYMSANYGREALSFSVIDATTALLVTSARVVLNPFGSGHRGFLNIVDAFIVKRSAGNALTLGPAFTVDTAVRDLDSGRTGTPVTEATITYPIGVLSATPGFLVCAAASTNNPRFSDGFATLCGITYSGSTITNFTRSTDSGLGYFGRVVNGNAPYFFSGTLYEGVDLVSFGGSGRTMPHMSGTQLAASVMAPGVPERVGDAIVWSGQTGDGTQPGDTVTLGAYRSGAVVVGDPIALPPKPGSSSQSIDSHRVAALATDASSVPLVLDVQGYAVLAGGGGTLGTINSYGATADFSGAKPALSSDWLQISSYTDNMGLAG